MRFGDDDPFFSEVSNLIDVIEDIEEDPDAGQILSSYEGSHPYLAARRLILIIVFQMLSERTSSHGLYVVLVSYPVQKKPLRLPKLNKNMDVTTL